MREIEYVGLAEDRSSAIGRSLSLLCITTTATTMMTRQSTDPPRFTRLKLRTGARSLACSRAEHPTAQHERTDLSHHGLSEQTSDIRHQRSVPMILHPAQLYDSGSRV